MTEYVVMPKTDWQNTCDKVREKSGNSNLIKSGEMAALIDTISGIDPLLEGSVTQITSNALSIQPYGLYHQDNLTSLNLPLATTLEDEYAVSQCKALATVNCPELTYIGTYAFYGDSALTKVIFPKVHTLRSSGLSGCSLLQEADFPLLTTIKGSSTFDRCLDLSALILRSNTACTLSSASLGYNVGITTPFYIYVPAALVDTYKAATNWSNYAANFRALEDYTVDGTTTGALDPDKI